MKNFISLLILACLFYSCEIVENDNQCSISNLEVTVGECNNDGTYSIVLNFSSDNSPNDFFEVFTANGEFLDYYQLSDLPLTIDGFEASGNDYDFLQVCINDSQDCCAAIEFQAPNCEVEEEDCNISGLEVSVIDCNPDGTYNISLNFEHDNAGNEYFDVFVRDNVHLGYYNLSSLPITIQGVEMSGYDYDYLKVCINDSPNCCAEVEYESPNCEVEEDDCNISGLEVSIIDCNPDGTYNIYVNFNHDNANNDYFDVYGNNDVNLGYYSLSSLPAMIQGVEMSGYNHDYIKVCINDSYNCCAELEYETPNCNN